MHDQLVGEAVTRAEAHIANDLCRIRSRCSRSSGICVHLPGQEVDVILNHVEPTWAAGNWAAAQSA